MGFGSGLARRKAGLRSTRRHRTGRDFGPGSAGQDRVSARELRNRRNPGFRSMDCQAEPGLRPGILPEAWSRASAGDDARGGRRTSVRNPPSGEPPGLRPCRGASGETFNRASAQLRGLRRKRARASARVTCLETSLREKPSPPRQGPTRRDSGGWRKRQPPFILRVVCGRSSQPRPASWQVG